MLKRAFVLINTAQGKARKVSDSIKQRKGVVSAHAVTGPYDVIVVVEAESLADIGDLVTSRIQSILSISRTVTCICLAR